MTRPPVSTPGWKYAAVLLLAALGTVACPGPAVAPPDDETVITVGDDFFRSNHVAVLPGELVRWSWVGSNLHNVTFDDPAVGDSPTQTSGSFTRTFTESFVTYSYYCTVHGRQRMSGIVEVR